jgi:hypothetical protein
MLPVGFYVVYTRSIQMAGPPISQPENARKSLHHVTFNVFFQKVRKRLISVFVTETLVLERLDDER